MAIKIPNTGSFTDSLVSDLKKASDPELAAARDDIISFMEYCFVDHRGNPWKLQDFHKKILELTLTERNLLIEMPRRSGKSSLMSVAYPLWRVMKNRDTRIMIISASESLAKQWLREIEHHMRDNERYKALAGNLVPELRKQTWTDKEKIVSGRSSQATHMTFLAMGFDGRPRGRRADLMIFDDVVNEQNSGTEYQREKVKDKFFKAFLPVLDKNLNDPISGQTIVVGTPYTLEDLYDDLSKKWGEPFYGDDTDQSY